MFVAHTFNQPTLRIYGRESLKSAELLIERESFLPLFGVGAMGFGRSLVALSALVLLLAVFSYKLYNRLFNIPVPENFPEKSIRQFQLMAFTMQLMRDMVRIQNTFV